MAMQFAIFASYAVSTRTNARPELVLTIAMPVCGQALMTVFPLHAADLLSNGVSHNNDTQTCALSHTLALPLQADLTDAQAAKTVRYHPGGEPWSYPGGAP